MMSKKQSIASLICRLACLVLVFTTTSSTLFGQDAIKVLMFGDEGHHRPSEFYRHLVDPLANAGIELTYTQELSDINPENLSKYAGLLIFANTEKIDQASEKALVDYVAGGGGLIPVHCASYCFLNSDKYIELVGAQFKSHGYTRFGTQVVDQSHEIMKGYKPFSAYDESYMHSRHNPDKTVLEVRSSESGPVSSASGEPYTWVRTSGNGRVFYTAWGHNYRTWEHPSFQDLLARGIRWAVKKPVTYEHKHVPQLAVENIEKDFEVPKMISPTYDEKKFTFQDVGAKIPNYTPGEKWGTQGELLTLMQDPIPAEESITTYSVPEGFTLSLWAKEMDKYWKEGSQPKTPYSGLGGKPIAMTWDERGRLWVCETTDYPNNLESRGGADRIRICEDTDHDGKADKFTVFAEKLSIPTTLVCYRGGVIIQNGPKTIYLKDTNGDDKADFRQELITGWALGDTHGGVSNLQYGPDNWIWGMQGYNNSQPVINGKQQQRFRQGFWRFAAEQGAADDTAPAYAIDQKTGDAETKSSDKFNDHTIRVTALEFLRATNNNTWGLGFSEEGYVFGSTANACPSVHMAIPNRYYDAVAGWSPKTLEQISDNYYFKAIHKHIRQVDQHGGYTAAAGHAIYTARNYPKSWWNRIGFVTDGTGHLSGSFVLQRRGAGYQSYDAFNTVASIDDWAAPIMAEIGPDGNVWVLDWYNYIVQHNPVPNGFTNGKGNAYESDLRDKRFGRIYRVHHGSTKQESTSRTLANAKPADLVAALSDNNMFWRKTAQRLIVEKNISDAATLKQLVDLASSSTVDQIGLNVGAMHAIWTLAGLAENNNKAAAEALKSACQSGLRNASGPVRHAAVMNAPVELLPEAIKLGLAKDIDAKVQVAVLLRLADGESKVAAASDTIADLAIGTDSVVQDDILLDAWTAAAATQPGDVLVALATDNKSAVQPKLLERVAVLSEHLARNNPTAGDIEKLLAMEPNSPIAVSVWQGLAKGWPRNYTVELSAAGQDKLRERFLGESVQMQTRAAILALAEKLSVKNLGQIVDSIQSDLFKVALDNNEAGSKRLDAWKQAIALAPESPKIVEATEELLTPQLSGSVADPAITALRDARVEGLTQVLLSQRLKLTPQLSNRILTTLLSRAETTKELLMAISKGEVQLTDLQLDQRQALLSHPNKEIATLAAEVTKATGSGVTSNRQGLVDEWMSITKMNGDVQNGIAMYKKHCALCHVHGDMGSPVGPNLTGMAVHPKEELLVHVLDPSRSVEGNFRTYQIMTQEGNVFTGMLAGESQNSLRLIDSQGKEHQILREDIEEMNASNKSLMPEGFESLMSKQEFSDLLSFLTNRGKYTPVPLTGVATVSSGTGLFYNRSNNAERIMLADWTPKKFGEVPFLVEDPQDGKRANIIMLQSTLGEAAAAMPKQVSLPCSGNVSAIHLLGGIAGWGYPAIRNESVSLIVRCNYADGTKVDHSLRNGKEIADYASKIDVPGSEYAFAASGRQIRYLKIPIDGTKPLASIDFVKGNDATAPIVFAVTIESETAKH